MEWNIDDWVCINLEFLFCFGEEVKGQRNYLTTDKHITPKETNRQWRQQLMEILS